MFKSLLGLGGTPRNNTDNPGRRNFLVGAARLAGGAALASSPVLGMAKTTTAPSNPSNPPKITTPNGDIEKGFRPDEIEKMFESGSVSVNDYYRPDILSSGKDSPFIKKRKDGGAKVINNVLVVVPMKDSDPVSVFKSDFRLNLPMPQDIVDELAKVPSGMHDGKKVRLVNGHGLIAETETIKGKAWVVLPPGTLLVNLDGQACIASCMNPIYRVDKRKCPPCIDANK